MWHSLANKQIRALSQVAIDIIDIDGSDVDNVNNLSMDALISMYATCDLNTKFKLDSYFSTLPGFDIKAPAQSDFAQSSHKASIHRLLSQIKMIH